LDMFDICLEFGRRSQANGEWQNLNSLSETYGLPIINSFFLLVYSLEQYLMEDEHLSCISIQPLLIKYPFSEMI
jgi:hypothetical protein